jgi:hypothetical protein
MLIVTASAGNQPGEAAESALVDSDAATVRTQRLSVERYKATIKGLTQFGDRREGTKRNRDAINWIEAQLRSYGCSTARLTYTYAPPPRRPNPRVLSEFAAGGGRLRGIQAPTPPNLNPNDQPDPKLRNLNSEVPKPGPREEVYCTKTGSAHPDEMYIVSAHMDGRGFGEAANDDGSGTALVMELARILNSSDIRTDRSVRFILWNNEETGLNGARAYVAARRAQQGREYPPGSGKFPEPKWLGIVQHDMLLFNHGMPRRDGTVSKEQRPEADLNIEFQSDSRFAAQSQALAWTLESANEKHATDYPASVGPRMTNTDSDPFKDLAASVSVRENERGTQIGSIWGPFWHQPTDLYAVFSEKDFRLGFNAAQTTLAAVAQLTSAAIVKTEK